MNHNRTRVAVFLLLLALGRPTAQVLAQTATTQTILANAITSSSTRDITVASATGMSASTSSAQTYIYVDTELMQVRAINGAILTVVRGAGGTVATQHNQNAPVWYGTIGGQDRSTGNTTGVFMTTDPIGLCTVANQQFSPVINYKNGYIWSCVTQNQPAAGGAPNFPAWQGSPSLAINGGFGYNRIADANYTATLADEFIDASSISTARTLTLPAVTGIYGKVLYIMNYTTGTGQTLTVTAPAGQTINNSANNTSVALVANGGNLGGVLRLVSTGLGWHTW